MVTSCSPSSFNLYAIEYIKELCCAADFQYIFLFVVFQFVNLFAWLLMSIFLQFSIDSLLLTVFPCYFSEPELPDAGGGQPLIGLDHEQAQGLIQSAVE